MNNRLNKNIFISLVGVLFLFLTSSISAQKAFEGKIKIKLSSDNQTILMNYYIKDKNLKMELSNREENGSFIMKGKNYLVLLPAQKMYMEISSEMLKNLPEMKPTENTNRDNKIDINKFRTGKTKKILGYNCEQWIINNKDGNMEIWVTNELGNFITMDGPMGKVYSPAWSTYLQNNGFFPMKVISNNGKSVFEVIEVDKKSLSDAIFSPPSNYKKMTIPGM